MLRLQPAHGHHLLERDRETGDGRDRLRKVRHQLVQDVHGLQGCFHAEVGHECVSLESESGL